MESMVSHELLLKRIAAAAVLSALVSCGGPAQK